jgi:isopentenyl-diphosphate delta-isomerase
MSKVAPISSRKSEHIRINLDKDVQSALTTGLEHYRFIHRALPEIDLDQIDMTLNIFARKLQAPILISSMTGGTAEASRINHILAEAAQESRVAMGLGSLRAALEHPELIHTYQVRRKAPDILLFANLGAIQLNTNIGPDQCQRAVDLVEADALILHFNALQEAVQADGDTHFSGLARKVETVCRKISVPVIAKEVGWGFSIPDIQLLKECGVSAIDVAGAGGTSWTQVEMHRSETESQRRLAAAFIDWGIPTAEAIVNVKSVAPDLPIIASGGLRTGLDIAKCVALGAVMGGMAGPFLKAAAKSLEDTQQLIEEIKKEIQVTMFACGAHDLSQLQQDKITYHEQHK